MGIASGGSKGRKLLNHMITLPCKHGTDSTEAPKAKNIEVAISLESMWQQTSNNFRRDSRDEIKEEPSFNISQSNELPIVDKHISSFVQVGNEEGKNDVNGKKTVHNIVCYSKCTGWFLKESKFKRTNPCSVEN